RPPSPALFPYTTLFRSVVAQLAQHALGAAGLDLAEVAALHGGDGEAGGDDVELGAAALQHGEVAVDQQRVGLVAHHLGEGLEDRSEEHTSELQSRENLV